MKLLVTGGRDFADRAFVFECLDRVDRKHTVMLLVHGACPTGADRWADEWAQARGVTRMPFPAQWKELGDKAGPIRNQRMLDITAPEAAVAFPGGRGTGDMLRRLERAGVPVWRPPYPGRSPDITP